MPPSPNRRSARNTRQESVFDRSNTSQLMRWWYTVDQLTLFAILLLMALGAVMVFAAGPAAASRVGLEPMHFVTRQYILLCLSVLILLISSSLPTHIIRQIAALGFITTLLLLMSLPFIGTENNGSVRWITIMGQSLQPSEIAKPCFAVVVAWILSESKRSIGFPGYRIACGLYALIAALLVTQPDFGMTLTYSVMFGAQLFMSGISWAVVMILVVAACIGAYGAYSFLPHVQQRIDRFLDPQQGEFYQVEMAQKAFSHGGIFGTGPGEGQVKWSIPDSHTDYIFAVAGEEFGAIVCLGIIGLYALIVLRGLWRLRTQMDIFILIASVGILSQFGIQAVINIGVATNLLPSKGMTLPLMSYGGSSMIGVAFSMGILLAFTRKRYGGAHVAYNKYGL